jgi:hypothetical protein
MNKLLVVAVLAVPPPPSDPFPPAVDIQRWPTWGIIRQNLEFLGHRRLEFNRCKEFAQEVDQRDLQAEEAYLDYAEEAWNRLSSARWSRDHKSVWLQSLREKIGYQAYYRGMMPCP